MVRIICGNNGTIDKFGGDSILAVWGVSETSERHAYDASRSALQMRKELVSFNQQRTAVGKPEIKIGIGLHSGIVMAGAIGSDQKIEYTVIGDTVNTAARIESLTKEFGTDILVSIDTLNQSNAAFRSKHVTDTKVRGRNEMVSLYHLIDHENIDSDFGATGKAG